MKIVLTCFALLICPLSAASAKGKHTNALNHQTYKKWRLADTNKEKAKMHRLFGPTTASACKSRNCQTVVYGANSQWCMGVTFLFICNFLRWPRRDVSLDRKWDDSPSADNSIESHWKLQTFSHFDLSTSIAHYRSFFFFLDYQSFGTPNQKWRIRNATNQTYLWWWVTLSSWKFQDW